MDERPIGFFDSGIGGLTALKSALKLLPNEATIYVADEANLPYGTKSSKEISNYSQKIINFLIKQNVKAIVCACNTSSAIAIPHLKKIYNLPIFGVIDAGAKKANQITKNQHIMIIATKATIKSKKYNEKLESLNSKLVINDLATQELVKIVENGDYSSKPIIKKIYQVLAPLSKTSADTLILGCTHFPILKEQINEATNYRFKLVDPGNEVIINLKDFLTKKQLLSNNNVKSNNHVFYTTGSIEHFLTLGSNFLDNSTIKVNHLDLE